MLKATDLRAGNIVELELYSGSRSFCNITPNDILQCKVAPDWFNQNHRPIKITPEILGANGWLKLGSIFSYGEFSYNCENNWCWYKGKVVEADIEFIHELQNLIHSLTGKEWEVVIK